MLSFCNACKRQVEPVAGGASGESVCADCGAEISMSSVDQLPKGTIINGFMVEDKLGQGGMGVVYKAKQLNLERYVALKLLSDELASDAEFVGRFFKEARAAASLSHPNIVQVYDAGSTSDGIYYFAMELIEGETLDTRISRDGPLPQKDALEIAVKIASALDYAWEKQGLCHGDIKPDNIILDGSGDAKLADLGLAKSIRDESDFKEGIMGTPLYAPPEMISGSTQGIDCRSDMYSFGATLYHIFSGQPPFPGDDPETVMGKHLNDKPAALSEVNGELNPAISDLVEQLLLKNPESRPPSWKEICRSLDNSHDIDRKVFREAPNTVRIQSSPSSGGLPTSKPLFKTTAFIAAATMILTGLAVAAYTYMDAGSRRTAAAVKQGASPSAPTIAEKTRSEWLKTKAEIARTDPETGIGLMQEYVRRYPSYIPPDAETLLQTLRQKLFSIQKKMEDARRKTDAIRKDVADLAVLTAVSDFKSMKKQELGEFSRRIEQNLVAVSNSAEILIPPESRSELDRASLEISDILLKMKAEEERKALAEKVKMEKERIEHKKMKIAEDEKRRQDKLMTDNLLDGYYLLLADFMSSYSREKDPARLRRLVEAWLGENKKTAIPESLTAKYDFMLDTVIPGEPLVFSVFKKNEAGLRGKSIPGNISALKISDEYLIDKILDKSIKLTRTMDKVKTGRTITQAQLTPEMISQLLQRILAPGSGVRPDKQDARIILSFYLLNGMRAHFSECLKTGNVLSDQEKENWESAGEDIRLALEDGKAIGLWREFRRLEKERKNQEALQLLMELRTSFKNTDFYKRYADEISRQIAYMGAYPQ